MVFRSHGREHVVCIHNNMYEGVDHTDEGSMASREILRSTPGYHGHHCVMVQMQECNLPVFLPNDEENCVEEFGYFRQEIDVYTPCYLEY